MLRRSVEKGEAEREQAFPNPAPFRPGQQQLGPMKPLQATGLRHSSREPGLR